MCVCVYVCVCVCVFKKKSFMSSLRKTGLIQIRFSWLQDSHSLSFADMHDDSPRAGYKI